MTGPGERVPLTGTLTQVLLQRIDKALATIDSPDGLAVAENTDEGTRLIADLRAALTGTETTHDA